MLENVMTMIAFSNDNDYGILPSKLLENEEWVKQMKDLFGISDNWSRFLWQVCLDLDEYDFLLSHCSHKSMLSAAYPNHKGAYLYFDTNLGDLRRSVKVSGHWFVKRHEGHKAKPKKESWRNTFYHMYPSQCLELKDTRQRRGTFQSFEMFIAGRFGPI